MSDQVNGLQHNQAWPELQLPDLLHSNETVRQVHATIEKEWDFLQRSACQTAAGRAMWKHVIHDPLAALLAGENYLRNLHEKMMKDHLNNAHETSGVILAVRTLWFDSRLEDFLNSPNGREAQVVLLGAGMDTRAYRLNCLKDSDVFEVDFAEVLESRSRHKRKRLDGKASNCRFLATKEHSLDSRSDWPDQLLPSIGFTHVKLSQIGDPDAHFGLLNDPLNLFNKLRSLPRSLQTNPEDGAPCCRLYLVEASGSPDQSSAHNKESVIQS
ncbi:unnamed protein product [Vicia faba]|uniref:S-adenosyl-L-methionine-dependent methyltransferase n=1 Tax=Vicia faba TaxID=3906 RepID=A0AAV0ZQ15_VICFA|nr:unnamed protein product [Vicia faba]